MLNRFFILVLIVATHGFNMEAQTGDAARIFKHFADHPNYSMDMVYTYYTDQSDKAVDVQNVSLIHYGKNSYMKLDPYEMLQFAEMTLAVDHEQKTLVLGNLISPGVPDPASITQMLDDAGISLEYVSMGSGDKKLIMRQNDNSSYSEIIYNAKTYIPRQIILHLDKAETRYLSTDNEAEKSRMVIDIKKYSSEVKSFPHSLNDYVIKDTDGYKPKADFQSWQLYNYLTD